MKGIAFLFFLTGVVCVALGMVWGIVMAASQDHLLAPAHAHLNLVGWATLGLFGLYYYVTPRAAESRLARIHYGFAFLGVVTLVPGIAIAVSGGGEMLASLGSFLSLGSMLIFLYVVIRHGLGEGTTHGGVHRVRHTRTAPGATAGA